MKDRNTEIYRVTLLGSVVNIILVIIKFAAGIIGASAAMIADAVHSLSDLITDIIVIVFVRISSKPADSDHHYGHGKYETLATLLVGGALLAVGIMLLEGCLMLITRTFALILSLDLFFILHITIIERNSGLEAVVYRFLTPLYHG